jgi:hypothetical protein
LARRQRQDLFAEDAEQQKEPTATLQTALQSSQRRYDLRLAAPQRQ